MIRSSRAPPANSIPCGEAVDAAFAREREKDVAAGLLRRDPNAIVAELDGKPHLLSLSSWTYLSFNGSGARIWELLVEPRERDWLLRRLLEEYDADEEQVGRELDLFLEDLRRKGFLL
jgi:hypothetical protein